MSNAKSDSSRKDNSLQQLGEEKEEEEKKDEEMSDVGGNEEIILELERILESEPKDYETRLKLIDVLRQSGELEALRKERSFIAELYTMPPNFWMDWIEDEKLVENGDDTIAKLFERAVQDFHSPEVYLEYIQWACGISLDFAREKMEEAVEKIGLRADFASVIWPIYLSFEKRILSSVSGEKAEKQKRLIESLYGRFIRVPHVGIRESWNDYIMFTDEVSNAYQRAFERSACYTDEIIEYEKRLECATELDAKLSVLMEYIAFEMQTNDPARIQMIFERALCTVASFPSTDLWLQYGSWLDTSLKIPQVSVKVYARAVRHVSCAAVWQQYFSALERSNASPDEIDSKWLDARDTITTQEEGFSLYRTYIYLLRRRAAKQGDDNYTAVLEKFDEGASFLAEKFGPCWDSPKALYRKNYALFLYTTTKQPDKARKIWNDILASGSGHLAAAWLEAANLERFFGNVNNARKLLYRAINSASDHPYMVFDALIQFERELGTIEELDKALEKVNAQVDRLNMKPEKSKLGGESSKKRKKGKSENVEVKRRKKETQKLEQNCEYHVVNALTPISETIEAANSNELQVDGDGFVVPQLPLPKAETLSNADSEGTSKNSDEKHHTVFVSNLDFMVSKEKIEEIFPNAKEVRLIYRGMSKLHKGFGYVEFLNEFEALEALKMDRKQIDGRPMYVSAYKPHSKGQHSEFRYSTGMEKNKVFVRNVHYEATEEQLKEIFATFGTVRSVRIVTHKSGKSKGCAYVEYEDGEHAANAVKSGNNLTLLERKLSVAISNPPKRKEQDEKRNEKPESSSSLHQRNKIDLVPRALTRTKVVQSGSSTSEVKNGSSISEAKKNMSNEQFRSFLK